MNNAIVPLFPYPLVICGQKYEFTDAEKAFIAELEMTGNSGNARSKNDRVLDRAELVAIRSFVDAQILNYKKNLLRIKDANDIYITQSWVNKSHPDQFHPMHKHPNSVISGVMFLDENFDESLPPIRFHRTQEMFPLSFSFDELNEFNASAREFDPVQGMLMLFPSLLEHDVDMNKSEHVRSSLSFNTFVRGTVGGKEQLTEVEIS
ncbi:MAG: TIGR02466 family protein [Woeseiaceae bacterium]